MEQGKARLWVDASYVKRGLEAEGEKHEAYLEGRNGDRWTELYSVQANQEARAGETEVCKVASHMPLAAVVADKLTWQSYFGQPHGGLGGGPVGKASTTEGAHMCGNRRVAGHH